jgi:hypothetical protein
VLPADGGKKGKIIKKKKRNEKGKNGLDSVGGG